MEATESIMQFYTFGKVSRESMSQSFIRGAGASEIGLPQYLWLEQAAGITAWCETWCCGREEKGVAESTKLQNLC